MNISPAPQTNSKPISYWWTTKPYRANTSLNSSAKTDVAIIGGGFTGLATAYQLKKMDPGLHVTVLESHEVGFGASGRNAGFAMTLFGLTMEVTALRFGKAKAKEAHHYMEQSVDHIWQMINEHELDCDAERSGFLRLATTPAYAARIQRELHLVKELGLENIQWLSKDEVKRRVNSPHLHGAWWEPRCVLLNPAKLAWEMKRLAESVGVSVYEHTPVQRIYQQDHGYRIELNENAHVRAEKIAITTNAFNSGLPQLHSKQVPAYTYIVLTEPLGERLHDLGWQGREGLEDARNLIHYFRLTADNRLLMGGGHVHVPFGSRTAADLDDHPETFAHLEQFITQMFPALKDVPIAQRWGGPVSVTLDMAPALGFIGGRKDAVYSLGCIGHGVSMSHYNGLTLAELLMGKESSRTNTFFVNRFVPPWPPEPLRVALANTIQSGLKLQDAYIERGIFS